MKFSKEELAFIREELQIEAEENETNEQRLIRIQDAAFEIEADESNRLEELTPRGKMAAALVTRLGEEE